MSLARPRFLTVLTATAVSLVGVAALSPTTAQATATADTTFNSASDVAALNDTVYDMAIQSDGKVVTVGDFTGKIKRFNTNGTLDTMSFTPSTALGGFVQEVEIASGAIVVAGYDGVIAFDASSGTELWRNTTATSVMSLVARPDGKLLALDTTNQNPKVAVIDPSNGSTVGTPINAAGYDAMRVAVGSDAKPVLCGVNKVERFDTNGSLDQSFTTAATAAFSGRVCQALAVQPDGKIVITMNVMGAASGVIRLNADGTPDTTFATNLGMTVNSTARAVLLANGYILVATNKIVRIGGDGLVDATFDPTSNTSVSAAYRALAVGSGGKLYGGISGQVTPRLRLFTIDTPTYTGGGSNGGGGGSTTAPVVVTPVAHAATATASFAPGKASLSKDQKAKLKKAVKKAKTGTLTTVTVKGYAKPKHGAYKKLATKRAKAVKSYLKSLGVKVTITTSTAKAKTKGKATVVINYTTTS